jgi:hypothetical protein
MTRTLTEVCSERTPRFDSPLALWIAIWQRQLVEGSLTPALSHQ